MPLAATRPTGPEKPAKRRNVISRGRTGCLTCRRRRLRCDEAKPSCNNCKRTNLECEGYAQRIAFRDQTSLVVQRAQSKSSKKARQSDTKGKSDGASHGTRAPTDGVNVDRRGSGTPASSHSADGVLNIIAWNSVDSYATVPRESRSQDVPSDSEESYAHQDDATARSSSSSSPEYIPSPESGVSNASMSLMGAFEFPEDYTYYEYSISRSFASLNRVFQASDILKSEPMSSHVYDAAMALAALNLSTMEVYPRGSMHLRRHAFHHSLKAVQGIRVDLASPRTATGLVRSTDVDTSFSLFATIMLLSNFELQRGCLLSWRSHMRGAASCLAGWYKDIAKKTAGMLMIKSFARMALLLRLYNQDYSVTTSDIMPSKLADWLNMLLRRSTQMQDRLLLLVEEVTLLEIQKRQEPALDEKWTLQSAVLLANLDAWWKDLSASERPEDDLSSGAYLTISSLDPSTGTPSLLRVPSLSFPHSSDPCAAAVNYAAYLCTGMRARTRYVPGLGRLLPPDAEEVALTICRIAAGISPVLFGQAFTYSYGMLPSVVGAYRWSSNTGLREWVKDWLRRYQGSREGIWNVSQTLRILAAMEQAEQAESPSITWQLVTARVVDEEQDPSPDLEETDSSRKRFKLMIRKKTQEGADCTNIITIE
ncbi:hypothetical protein ASPZODRAFT_12510 [Penicilliopsis zonata CBS 506.65]|uniref:Zn(2)-C6 fungal-type domain-containing protein n=1 Tax=Penicilliopsis zonata CBS 506.65 TaxID=1073090 RepID=A0A1L9SX12_9EURO|nr:hypothetical protein ASPZODRAFT_12510 [Penicilliopsis zonata CBS 506.65]OJJ51696.1 hypothetical protein ASPZODRAFT_12510 [Penicilliopsis zonata CBS 506.65]